MSDSKCENLNFNKEYCNNAVDLNDLKKCIYDDDSKSCLEIGNIYAKNIDLNNKIEN